MKNQNISALEDFGVMWMTAISLFSWLFFAMALMPFSPGLSVGLFAMIGSLGFGFISISLVLNMLRKDKIEVPNYKIAIAENSKKVFYIGLIAANILVALSFTKSIGLGIFFIITSIIFTPLMILFYRLASKGYMQYKEKMHKIKI